MALSIGSHLDSRRFTVATDSLTKKQKSGIDQAETLAIKHHSITNETATAATVTGTVKS